VKESALIVGDAAGLTNPLFGGGVHTALISGRLAGESIAKAFRRRDLGILNEYETRISAHPITDPVLRRARRILYSFNDDEWNFVGDAFYRRDWRKASKLRILRKFMQNPALLMKSRDFLTVKRAMDICTRYGV
jgi:digeranylgeranylglycerophospholipid reductase